MIRLEKHNFGQLDVMEVTEKILNKEWNYSQYYFSTYQNDSLLHFIQLDDTIEDEGNFFYNPGLFYNSGFLRNFRTQDIWAILQPRFFHQPRKIYRWQNSASTQKNGYIF